MRAEAFIDLPCLACTMCAEAFINVHQGCVWSLESFHPYALKVASKELILAPVSEILLTQPVQGCAWYKFTTLILHTQPCVSILN